MRDILRQLRRASTMPPGELLAKVRRKLRGRRVDAQMRRRDAARPTFLSTEAGDPKPHRPLARLVGSLDVALPAPHRDVIAELAGRALAHEFDLLGSGWVHVANVHGLEVSDANRAEAERIAALLPEGYTPIDWHVDFKSEAKHRWDARVWYRDQPQVVGKGIDVKLPWELARMQHLPLFAWGYALAAAPGAGHEMPESAERYRDAFRNQVLDFIAHNPPRFGINWNCAMDVGIRVAGWVLTHDLLCAVGAEFDDAFAEVFARSVREHADHLAANLEWDETVRGNHYLADIAGLLIASAYLPAGVMTDRYLHFAARELVAETLRQFHADGSNFEASTSYHRLSAEMVVYALAVLQGVSPGRREALEGDRWHPYRPGEPSPPLKTVSDTVSSEETVSDTVSLIPPEVIDRVARMARFTEDLLDRHGRDPQIGDNDSGRFFKLLPATTCDTEGVLREDTRNHRHLIDAVDGFFPPQDESAKPTTSRDRQEADLRGCLVQGVGPLPHGRGSLKAETQVIRALLGGAVFERPELPPFTDHIAYPGMGLYLFRHGRLTTIVRCGEVGQNGNGGHAHDDALSFVLYVDGEPIVVDPGTGCYTPDPVLRDKMRHYARHNSVSIEDTLCRYAELRRDGLFRMPDRAQAGLLGHSASGVVGRHLLFGQPTRREFRCWPGELEVADQAGVFALRYALLHFAPGVSVTQDAGEILLRQGEIALRLTLRDGAEIEVSDDVYSASYGAPLVACPQLRYRLQGSADCVCSIRVVERGV